MYIYVPDKVAADPPILLLVHYCGGTASAVFGQAQGGGIVSAADQYGFIMVVPSSGRCWDVQSNKTWTRDGGGDSHAIKQMVTYAISKYAANADRVYSTGDSSGAMMTELLLALYPDIFKAGAAFAGMPAGCRGASESGNGGGYSGACASGSVTHTAQEWGDIARKLDPGYTGHRPRVQLFHGDADMTINYANFTEAIKEWTNVLGLSATPSSTDMGLTLGTHQATRQRWLNSCGYPVLEGFTSLGGDHGPSDALFKANYVIPFLGLDKTGPVDPEIQQCGNGGPADGGARPDAATGGGGRDAGLRDGGRPGTSSGGDGGAGTGTASTTGGSVGPSGGGTGSSTTGTGGSVATGGSAGSTASTTNGGGQASGGSQGGNGSTSGGSASASGGVTGSGGAVGSGGNVTTGDSAGNGTSSKGGASATSADAGDSGSSGGCTVGRVNSNKRIGGAVFGLGLALLTLARGRRRRRERPEAKENDAGASHDFEDELGALPSVRALESHGPLSSRERTTQTPGRSS